MTSEIDNLPTIEEKLVDVFDEYGTSEPPKINRVKPILGSEQKAIAGKKGNISKKFVGYTAYSEYFNSLVYMTEKERRNIIRKVQGRGFAISKSIINELKENNVEYVFGGMREKNTILVFSIESFTGEFHIEGWDEQLYATIDEDVLYEIPRGVSDVFTDYPSKDDTAITRKTALNKIK